MKFYKPEQNPNRLLQKGPYQVILLFLGGYRPPYTEMQMSLMASHKQVNLRNEIEFEIGFFNGALQHTIC